MAQRTKKEIEEDKSGPRTPEELILVGGVNDIPNDQVESAELANCIQNANSALAEKAEVLSRIQSARMLSTLLVENGSGSRDQVAWVRFYLPRKTRKTNGVTDEEE